MALHTFEGKLNKKINMCTNLLCSRKKNSALMGSYAWRSGNSLPTFRDKLSVRSSGVKNPLEFLDTEGKSNRMSRKVGKKLPLLSA